MKVDFNKMCVGNTLWEYCDGNIRCAKIDGIYDNNDGGSFILHVGDGLSWHSWSIGFHEWDYAMRQTVYPELNGTRASSLDFFELMNFLIQSNLEIRYIGPYYVQLENKNKILEWVKKNSKTC